MLFVLWGDDQHLSHKEKTEKLIKTINQTYSCREECYEGQEEARLFDIELTILNILFGTVTGN